MNTRSLGVHWRRGNGEGPGSDRLTPDPLSSTVGHPYSDKMRQDHEGAPSTCLNQNMMFVVSDVQAPSVLRSAFTASYWANWS